MQPWTRMPCCSCWLHASARQAHPRTATGGYSSEYTSHTAGWNNLNYVKTCRTYPLLQFRDWKVEAFFGFVFPMFSFQVTKPGPLWDLKQIAATIDGPATFRTPWAWSLAWKKWGAGCKTKRYFMTVYELFVMSLFDLSKIFKDFYVIWGYDYDNDVYSSMSLKKWALPEVTASLLRILCPSPSPAIDAEGVDLGTALAC